MHNPKLFLDSLIFYSLFEAPLTFIISCDFQFIKSHLNTFSRTNLRSPHIALQCTVGEIGPWHYLNSYKGCKRFKWCSDGLYDCFYGCLEGPSIFLESFIFLIVLICACGEGEIVAVMACLSLLRVHPLQSPDMQLSLGRSWQLQKTNLESQDSFLGFLIVNKCYFLEYGQKTLEWRARGFFMQNIDHFAVKKSLCNAPDSSRRSILESRDSFLG